MGVFEDLVTGEVPRDLQVSSFAAGYLSAFIAAHQPEFGEHTPHGWYPAWSQLAKDNERRGVETTNEQRGRLLTIATDRVIVQRHELAVAAMGPLIAPVEFGELDLEVLAPVIDCYAIV